MACFVPRISTEFSFLFLPSVNQKKKRERLRASESAPLAGEGDPWLIGVLPSRPVRSRASRVGARPPEDGAGPECSRVRSVMRNAGFSPTEVGFLAC